MPAIRFLVLAAAFLSGTGSPATTITLQRSLGLEDGDLFLHQPQAVAWAADGSIYILNAGECRVLHLDGDWNLLGGFGACGQGPGEFENPVGLVASPEGVLVFEMARITRFGPDGTYLETLVPGLQYSRPVMLAGRLAAAMGAGTAPAAFLDNDGSIISTFGPECPEDFFEAFKACRNIQILPHPGGLCLLLNPIAGSATLVAEDGTAVWTRAIREVPDTARYDQSDDRESVSMTITFAMGLGALSPDGEYWFVIPPEAEGEPTLLRRTDADLKPLEKDVPLPDGVTGIEPFFTPGGALGLLSPWESVIHLLRVEE